MEVFKERVSKYLHIVLCFSQIGETFKQTIKMYPAIVNCCTVDWFFEWPEDALSSIASFYLEEVPIQTEQKDIVTRLMKQIHFDTIQESSVFKRELGRINYVTGSSFLEVLEQFKILYDRKKKEIINKMTTY